MSRNGDEKRRSNYRETMYLIVNDAFLFAGRNPTDEEILATAEIWARILIEIIPEHRLQESFDHAVKTHTSNFPVNGYEIKTAFEELQKQQAINEMIQNSAKREANKIANCSMRHLHDDDALIEYERGYKGEKVKLPCRDCRVHAHDERAAEYRRMSFDEMIASVPKLAPAPKSAIETVDALIDQISAARLKSQGNGELKNGYAMLIRVKARLFKGENYEHYGKSESFSLV